jgi:hypothetical protein
MAVPCPQCTQPLLYDDWEDCYACVPCNWFFYPHEVGQQDNPDAGIWKLGKNGETDLSR